MAAGGDGPLRLHRAGLALALSVLLLAPVGAGVTGGGSLAMLAFTGVFFLANAVMRPAAVQLSDLPRLALQLVTAGAFASLLVGLGQTVRALGQVERSVDLGGWVFAAAWALVLARLIWPRRMNDRFADGAEALLRRIDRAGQPAARNAPADPEGADDLSLDDAQSGRPDVSARPPAPSIAEPGDDADQTVPPQEGESPDAVPAAAANDADRTPEPALPVDPARTEQKPAETLPARPRPGTLTPATAAPVAPPPTSGPASGPDPSPNPGPNPGPTPPALAAALARLDDLPRIDPNTDELRAVMETLSAAAPPATILAVLTNRATSERDRRALANHVTDPWIAGQRRGKGEAAGAFETIVAAADAVALADFATLSLALLEVDPEARLDMPQVLRLIDIANQIEANHETEAELLVSLAHELEDLQVEAEARPFENGADA